VATSVGEGVSEKLRRAYIHRDDLYGRIQGFIDGGAYRAFRDDKTEAGKRLWRVHVLKEPPVVEWGALIGDCLFNFRSALDHLAYDLAVAHSGFPLAPEVDKHSEFPIFVDSPLTASKRKRMIGGVDPKAGDLIETMQPYGRKDRAALKYLHDLQRFDKHRTLHLVAGAVSGGGFWGEEKIVTAINFSPLKDRDVIAEGPLPTDPESGQDPHFSFGVAFAEGWPGQGYSVRTMLDWIGQHIEKGVIAPLLPFL
jgi:hypothetical protein